MAKIELIKEFEDGNWVAYGQRIGGSLKRLEIARGSGTCPLAVGEETSPTDAKPAAEPVKISDAELKEIRIMREVALKAAVELAVCMDFMRKQGYLTKECLDGIAEMAGFFESWLRRGDENKIHK